jgi:hypothetical protein
MEIFNEIVQMDVNMIHSDADAIWLRNPLEEYFYKSDSDFVFSQGTIWPQDVKDNWEFVLCCGLFQARCTPVAKVIMGLMYRDIQNAVIKDDQVTVNRYLASLDIKWRSRNTYQVPIFGQYFKCSTDIMYGMADEIGLQIAVLPHALFQRLHMKDEPAYVKHILSNKTNQSKKEMFIETNCYFL